MYPCRYPSYTRLVQEIRNLSSISFLLFLHSRCLYVNTGGSEEGGRYEQRMKVVSESGALEYPHQTGHHVSEAVGVRLQWYLNGSILKNSSTSAGAQQALLSLAEYLNN